MTRRISAVVLLVAATLTGIAARATADTGAARASAAVTVRDIGVGQDYACALLSNHRVRCWGRNDEGELGNGTTSSAAHPRPVTVKGITTATRLSVGYHHACAVLADRSVRCWGAGASGQLGNGSATDSAVPVKVASRGSFRDVAAGTAHTCGTLSDGAVLCWGTDDDGELGSGGGPSSTVPGAVAQLTGATAVTAGNQHTCALVGPQVDCWGSGDHGRLGNGSTADAFVPTQIPPATLTGVTGVDAGMYHSCALVGSGTAYCWGVGTDGQLGQGAPADSTTPTPVQGGLVWRTIDGGTSHTCGVTTAGQGYCWGANNDGELGNNTTAVSTAPTIVSLIGHLVAISAGDRSSCATNGTKVWCWGLNNSGLLGTTTPGNPTVPNQVSHIFP